MTQIHEHLPYSISVSKQYFNFSASHFLLFSDGTREPLHGHNYRVYVKAYGKKLGHDMVMDFLHIKPIIREECDALDHKLLLPKNNPSLKIYAKDKNYQLITPEEDEFSIPMKDCLLLPLNNISAERLCVYLAEKINASIQKTYSLSFPLLEVEVEETPGQSAKYLLKNETNMFT